jgi:hypothetical protein
MIRISILFCIVLLAAAAPAPAQPAASAGSWRTDVPCTAGRNPALTVAGASTETQVPGCVRAHCAALPDGHRVCSCTGDTTIVMRLEDRGRTIQEWPADYSLAGIPSSLQLLRGDLDGDGRAETVVSEWLDMSNGLGIRYYRLTILDGRDPARTPVVLAVEDFEPGGSFVRPAGGGDCRLIATRWSQLDDPGRGGGTYFIGQWMRYRDGRLEHDPARPVVARRLLNSFADARSTTPGSPFAHLRHRGAQARPALDAGSLPPFAGRQVGTVRGGTGGWQDFVDVSLASGETVRYRIGVDYGDDYTQTTTWLVDGATGRPYPREYTPADRRWLDGAPVAVATYSDGERVTVHHLVLQPRTP